MFFGLELKWKWRIVYKKVKSDNVFVIVVKIFKVNEIVDDKVGDDLVIMINFLFFEGILDNKF